MRNLSTILFSAALIGAMAGSAAGEQISGTLMTTMCAARATKTGPDAVAKHERTCNLKPDCAKTGFGVVTEDNKFIGFDEDGNAKALKALQESTKKNDMKVIVEGEIQDGKIKVSSLKLLD